MKLDMSKWKALSIKNRLKKGFRLTTFVASASGVIAGILMILVSMRYSSALTFYGFSQGDIGKVMVTFSETRSATRALIGYTASDTLSKMSDTHDSKKESFQKYWKELQSSIKTGEEQDMQRVQVRQVKDSQLLRDKSEVFQSRVPRLQLTHVSL